MRTPMSARVAPMEQAPAPAMWVPLDAPGDQRLALGLDLRADEVRCVAPHADLAQQELGLGRFWEI